MAGLTTHILDTARGRPAAGVRILLARVDEDGARHALKEARTNEDGRAALLDGGELKRGVYELEFHIGEYFADSSTPPFLQQVPVRFGVADEGGHYHIPLLVSPYGYSTYRGS